MAQLSTVGWPHELLPVIDGPFRSPREGWLAVSSRGKWSDASRPALHYIGRYGCKCRVVAFARANPDDLFQRLHEDFPVADLAGARCRQDRLDRWFHERLRASHFDFHFVAELEYDRRATIMLDDFLFATMPAHSANADSSDAGLE